MVLVFCPLLTNKTHPAGGFAGRGHFWKFKPEWGKPLGCSRSGREQWHMRSGSRRGVAVYLECLAWPRLSQAPEPLAVTHHRSLGHNIVHNPGTLVITRKLRVLHVVSAGNLWKHQHQRILICKISVFRTLFISKKALNSIANIFMKE